MMRLVPGPRRHRGVCRGVERCHSAGTVFKVSFRGSTRCIKKYVTKKEHCLRVGTGNSMSPYMFVRCSGTGVCRGALLRTLGDPVFVTCRSNRPFGRGVLHPYPVLRGPRGLHGVIRRSNTGSASLRSPRSIRRLYTGYSTCTRR